MIIRNDNIKKLTLTQSDMYSIGENFLKVLNGESGNAISINNIMIDLSEVDIDYKIPGFKGTLSNPVLGLGYSAATASYDGTNDELIYSTLIVGDVNSRANIQENADVYLYTRDSSVPTICSTGSGTVSVYIMYDRIDF